MSELTFTGLDIGRIEPGEDLVDAIAETTADTHRLRDADVVAISSKVVSMAEGRIVDAGDVRVTDRDERVASVTGIDPSEVATVYDESEVLGAIPVAELGRDIVLEKAVDRVAAEQALDTMPAALLTERNGRLCTNAGVDWSNSPTGKMTMLPEDPDRSARRIREALEDRTGADLAVVLADSEIAGAGTIDVAVGCSGIEAVDSNFGKTDLYGEPKVGGIDLLATEIAAGSALLFGQADEQIPVVVVRGLEYDEGERTPEPASLVRRGLRKTASLTARLKIRERI